MALLATWMTLPIAGTSLMLMDPYVTARSISTPCVLLALAGVLKFALERNSARWKGLVLCCGGLAAAVVMHPLMAAYGVGCALLLGCLLCQVRQVAVWRTLGLAITAVGAAAVLEALGPKEGTAYQRVAMTRYYWFIGEWHSYEWIGLAAPLLIVAVVAFGRRGEEDGAKLALARMAAVCGLAAVVIAMLFARASSTTYLVARLQPLRVFQTVYVVMILMIGGALAEHLLQGRVLRGSQRLLHWAA